MIKSRLMATAFVLAVSAGAASAADLGYKVAPVPAAVPYAIAAYTWTGAYVGVQAGYGWGDSSWKFKGGGNTNPGADGFLAGLHGGLNWQYGAMVLGVDTSWSWSDVSGSKSCPNNAYRCSVDINWTADIRGRLGYAFDRLHVYGAAGFAGADVDSRARGPANYSASKTHTGWTAGLGAEYAVTNNVILGLEWKYTDLGSEQHNLRTGGGASSPARIDLSTNVVQIRASYKF